MHPILRMFAEEEPLLGTATKCVYVVAELNWPPDVSYRVKSRFGESYDPRWRLLDGIDATFSISMYGKVASPEEFGGQYVDAQVNPLGEADRFEHIDRGTLGDGWVRSERFQIRIYTPNRVAAELVQSVVLFAKTGRHEPRVFRMGFRLVELKAFKYHVEDDSIGFRVSAVSATCLAES